MVYVFMNAKQSVKFGVVESFSTRPLVVLI